MISAYRHPDRNHGRELMTDLIGRSAPVYPRT